MANILYVYAHPTTKSFNFQLKQKGCATIQDTGHNLLVSDLYKQQFNPIAQFYDFNLSEKELNSQYFASQKIAYTQNTLASDIKNEIEKVRWAEHLIFQFPLWWFSAPAILKGWFDRILVKGFAYDASKILSEGLLKGKTASLVVTTQSGAAAYQPDGLHQSTIETFLHPIHHTLRFVGITTLPPFAAYEVFDIDEQRQNNIFQNYEIYIKNLLSSPT